LAFQYANGKKLKSRVVSVGFEGIQLTKILIPSQLVIVSKVEIQEYAKEYHSYLPSRNKNDSFFFYFQCLLISWD
jgi:hypothetical protein